MYFPLKSQSGPIFTKFHVEPSVKGALIMYFHVHTSLTKMTAILIDVENHLKTLFRIEKTLELGLSIEHCR